MNAPTSTKYLAPELGLVYGLQSETYHAGSNEVSNSILTDLAQSPLHCYARHYDPARPPRKERSGQLEGTLAHCTVLEPDEFDKRYAIVPKDAPRRPTDAQWKAKKPNADSIAAMEWWEPFLARIGDKLVVSREQYDTALWQAESIRRLPDIRALLAVGQPEVSAYWTDELTGMRCRCRPDWVHPANASSVILLDVKTYSDASPREFARQVARKGYHRQDAFYSDGFAQASGKAVAGFVFIAVETEWPYAACAHMLDDPGREKGRAEIRVLLDRYARCRRENVWPGYSETIELLSLPAWMA